MTSATNIAILFHFLPFIHSVLFIVSLNKAFPVDAGFLCNNAAMLRDTIKDIPLNELIYIFFGCG
jgi:hypothetical protein